MTHAYDIYIPSPFRSRLTKKEGLVLTSRRIVSRLETLKRRRRSSDLVVFGECPNSLYELVRFSNALPELKLKIESVALLAHDCDFGDLSTFLTTLRRTMRRPKIQTFTTASIEVYKRIIEAHLNDAHSQLIATASVIDDTLAVWSCEPRLYQVELPSIPALRKIPKSEWRNFEISETGSHIHWSAGDIDLNLESIRYRCDPKYQREVDKRRIQEIKAIGEAVKSVRVKYNLKQTECGITEREMRRIEKGEVLPHSTTLKKLAKAHGLELSNYLSFLATG